MFRRIALGAALGVMVAFAAAPLHAADRATAGQKQYLSGVAAYDAADYETAARLFRAAISEDSSEGLAKFSATGLNKEDYLPHFYLGLSLEKLGQRAAALPELKESAREGAIRGRATASRILDSAIARLEATRIASGQTVPTGTPHLPVATVPPPAPTSAPHTAETRPPATRAVEPPRPPATPSRAAVAVPTREPRATATPRAVAPPAPSPARATPPPPPLEEGVAAAREGVRAYFKGDYASAVRQLEPVAPRVPAARLFLAYSLAGSQLLATSRDEGVLARARREYETARHDIGKLDERLISPAVRALLASPSR
jgi:tetratricopeptide (TPR) repeat protein